MLLQFAVLLLLVANNIILIFEDTFYFGFSVGQPNRSDWNRVITNVGYNVTFVFYQFCRIGSVLPEP